MKDPRTAMIEAFIHAVESGVDLLVTVSDSTSTSKINPFVDRFPDRVVNVGIAEQNLVGLSAGLALGGYTVATANAAPFLVNRSAEQVRNDIAYSQTNVKMMGLNPGFAYGALGPTHHSLEDISMMRSLGGVDVFSPCDPKGTYQAVLHALQISGPAYIRVDSGGFPDIPENAEDIGVNEPILMREGRDVTIMGLGTSAHAVRDAASFLAKNGIRADAWGIPALRPLNTDRLAESIRSTGVVVTVESHSIHGGLGSFIAENIADRKMESRLLRLGIPEGRFAPASPRSDIEKRFSLDAAGIARQVEDLLERKG